MPDEQASSPAEPGPDRVAELLRAAGVHARPLRAALAALQGPAPVTLAELVGRTGLPRRTVQTLLRAAGSDLTDADGRLTLHLEHRIAYRDRCRAPADRGPGRAELVHRLERLIAAAPRPVARLDHVAATAETVADRAYWLASTYELTGARLLFLGDHDLTALATAALCPDASITVVDVDERILQYVAEQGGGRIRCRYADLRHGLPECTRGWADLVVTDPPYTPAGIALFLGRGLQLMRPRTEGRLVLSYGYGRHQPELGRQVQQAIVELELVFAAVLPGFNRYHGAQAIGSASDLYVLQPTRRSWSTVDKSPLATGPQIYTHGAQSVEADDTSTPELQRALTEAATDHDRRSITVSVGAAAGPGEHRLDLARLLRAGRPADWHGAPTVVAADLRADPGPWLLRLLLATNADHLAVLLPNAHPDLATAAGQQRLVDLIQAKYRLRLRRSTPDGDHAIVEATASAPEQSQRPVRHLLDRAHGRLGNVWRAAGGAAAPALDPALRPARLIDLPRHQIAELVAALQR